MRRFTGGRGVLHDDEVTYSVVASVTDGVPRGIAASYRFFAASLAAAYRSLGVDADLVPREGGVSGSSACYLHSTTADLSLAGRKLSGSAQVWLHETVLQHGSFVIARDVAREAGVFRLSPSAARKLTESTVTLGDELPASPVPAEVVAAAVDAFEQTLGVDLQPGEITEAELGTAERLLDQVRIAPP